MLYCVLRTDSEHTQTHAETRRKRMQNWKCSAATIIYYSIAKTKLVFASEMHFEWITYYSETT